MIRRHPLDGLDADIRDHIERETQDNIDRGMAPGEARDAALRAFGNIAMTTEETRAVWIPVWLDQLAQDTRYGLRMLRRNAAFSFVVILTLAVGIGLTTAVFSVVNAVLVRPLSYPAADRLVWVATYDDRPGDEFVASPDFAAWREQSSSFERLAGFFRDFRDALQDLSDEPGARVAILTPGPLNETYFEHAYLSRYLGFLLVEGGDLTVRDGIVYVRTIGGLKRVGLRQTFATFWQLPASTQQSMRLIKERRAAAVFSIGGWRGI